MPEPEILPPEPPEFPLLEDTNGILALFDEKLADGGGLPVLDLPRIRVASGGATNFRVETATGEESPQKIEGVLVSYRTARVYWKAKAVGKKPPDCSSIDGFIGVGDPGGECAKCPFARFGSALKPDGSKSTGQACKEIRQALFLMSGEMLPHLLMIPPTSLKAFNQYTMTMLSARAPYWGALTQMTLQAAKSEDNAPYAKIIFRLGKRIAEEHLMAFKAFHTRMKAVLKPAIIDASAYEIAEHEDRLIAAPRADGLVSGPRGRMAGGNLPLPNPPQRASGAIRQPPTQQQIAEFPADPKDDDIPF